MNNDQALPANAGETFPAVFLSKYSRRTPEGRRETWTEAVERSVTGLDKLGHYTPVELSSILTLAQDLKVLPSGRWLWVGGTKWVEQPENYGGGYNCGSLVLDNPNVFAWAMSMAMQGTGTGAVLEQKYIDMLPHVLLRLNIEVVGEFGSNEPLFDRDKTEVAAAEDRIYIAVGDSREGWVEAYQYIINLAMVNDDRMARGDTVNVTVDISKVRPKGQRLKGFGGVANPEALPGLFPRMQQILNGAVDRDGRLTAVECCLLIDEASKVVVAGNLRRSAGMRQGGSHDETFAVAKDNLWQQGEDGQWRIDADRDALRMANHTRVFHNIPTLEEVTASVTKQFYSGEGAIQYAPEAIARANADLLKTTNHKADFLQLYEMGVEGAEEYLRSLAPEEDDRLIAHRMGRYGMNPCFAAGTMVVTSSGHKAIESLVNKTAVIWDGNTWVSCDNFRVTARNEPVWKLTLSNDEEIWATPYHTFLLDSGDRVPLKDLAVGSRLKRHLDIPSEPMTVKAIEDVGRVDAEVYCCTVASTHSLAIVAGDLMVGQCGEIVGEDFYCNLSEVHLKTLDPLDLEAQVDAFRVGGLVVSALLHHKFENERQQYSREQDPIVGVSFTGLFDFFVNAFGLTWLEWWQAGRPAEWSVETTFPDIDLIGVYERMFDDRAFTGIDIGQTIDLADFYVWAEQQYLKNWKDAATKSVWDYCDRHHLKRPNRCTTVQPAGTKSLLTSSSPGWHPPKGACYIRRITYIAQDPLALALKDLGYNVIPGQTDRDETGALLDDPMDPRCTEWLVEFPIQTAAGTIAGVEGIDFNRFSACAQLDFYMQVQNYYTAHNTSSTIELREDEIEEFSAALHKQIGLGFMSSALLPRHDAPFPRMPFEVVSKAEWKRLSKEVSSRAVIQPDEFYDRLAQYDNSEVELAGPAQCDSDFCQK